MSARAPVWRVLVDPPLPGPENMAWDHTLALWCGPGDAVARFYTWARPTLSLGRNEPARGVYLSERLESAGVDVVRRPTGGRAVLHHRELTYSVCVPIRALGGARGTYAAVNRALAEGLRLLGAPVELAGPGPALRPDAGPCFRDPAEGEVLADDPRGRARKLVGSAQVRMGQVLLQHGSVLLEDDQCLIPGLRTDGGGDESRPATLREALGRPVELGEVRAALMRGFASSLPGDWRAAADVGATAGRSIPEAPGADVLERYRSPDWTWRK